MQKVRRRKQFPYAEQDYERPDSSAQDMATEDFDKIRALIKSGNKDKLNSFINSRMAATESASSNPGLQTRDYMNALTGESVLRNDPELAKVAREGSPSDLGRSVRSTMFPNIDRALKAHNLSNEIKDSLGDSVEPDTGVMRLSGSESLGGNIGTAIHENAHLLDSLARKHSKDKFISTKKGTPMPQERESSIKQFLKGKPASLPLFTEDPEEDAKFMRETTNKESYNKYRDKIVNDEVPNFADYSFPEGEFKSDMIRNPVDVQKESGDVHHIDRNQTYDNMIKAIEDEGKLDRVTKNDRFKKLRGLIA